MTSLQIRELETIHYFCHMTTTQNMHNVLESGTIKPHQTDSPYWTALARDKNSPIGVWFSASLYHGELPMASQYGENRLMIPCQHILSNMISPLLYLETFYYFESNMRNQIIRLILVDGEKYPREREWCEKRCLKRLNMSNNKFLILDRDRRKYKCVKNDGKLFPYIWIEVLVVGNVQTFAIDTVQETSPLKSEAIPGKVPPLL